MVIITTVLSLALFVSYKELTKENPLQQEAESLREKSITSITLQNLGSGSENSNDAFHGEVFLIYSLSSCDACRKELQFLSKNNANAKTRVFAVMTESEQDITEYVKKNDIKIPVLIDKDGEMLRELDLKNFPTNLKLNDGKIKKAFIGLPQNPPDLLEQINY